MRRVFLFLLVISASLVVSSCLTIKQDLTLKRNGSGEKVVRVDLGEMFSNPLMGMFSEEEEMPKEKKDSSWVLIDDIRDYNPQWTAAEVAMLEKATGRIVMDLEEGIMDITVTTPFASLQELKQIETLMAEANSPEEDEDEDGEEGSGGMPDFSGFGDAGNTDTEYKLGKKKLELMTPVSESLDGLFGEFDLDGGEGMNMFKGFLEGSTMVYTYHLPGKVKKVSGLKDAEIDGNTVRVTIDLLESIESPELTSEALTGEIKFK